MSEPAKSTNQFFPMPPSGAYAWISAYISQSSGRGGVHLTFGKDYDKGPAIAEMLLADKEALERELQTTLTWEDAGPNNKVYIIVPRVTFKSLDDPADRQRVVNYLADMAERMNRVMRPRLEAFSRAPL